MISIWRDWFYVGGSADAGMAADDDSASSSDAENVGVVSGAAPVGGQGIGRVGRLLWISREVLGINVSVWFESDGRVRRNGIGQAKRDSSDAVSGAPSTRAHNATQRNAIILTKL